MTGASIFSPQRVFDDRLWFEIKLTSCAVISCQEILKYSLSPLIHLYILYGNKLLIHYNVTPTFNPISPLCQLSSHVNVSVCVFLRLSLFWCRSGNAQEQKYAPHTLLKNIINALQYEILLSYVCHINATWNQSLLFSNVYLSSMSSCPNWPRSRWHTWVWSLVIGRTGQQNF